MAAHATVGAEQNMPDAQMVTSRHGSHPEAGPLNIRGGEEGHVTAAAPPPPHCEADVALNNAVCKVNADVSYKQPSGEGGGGTAMW